MDWRRDDVNRTRSVLAEADAVIAFGDDEAVAAIRHLARSDAKFWGCGHKLSFGVVGREANVTGLAEAAADDVCVYDQQGCMSPHAFYVEEGAREFAGALAGAMAQYQLRIPRGRLTFEEAAAISKLCGAYEFRAASDKSVAVWAGDGYLVIYEDEQMFTPSCLNRMVFVKPYRRFDEIVAATRHLAGHISTVGLAPLDDRAKVFGADRVCRIGQMQRPQLLWSGTGKMPILRT
jgi:hypothetical protein